VAAGGGIPERLTWHPSSDVVRDFTPDGSAVLFSSGRNSHTGRHQQLYTVSITGGHPTRLPIPQAVKATYSPDGSKIAYTPLGEPFVQWKNYRGGQATRIWIYDVEDHSIVEVPQPPGRSNDTDPMWIGDRVYLRSDRDGEFNLYSFDPEGGGVSRLEPSRSRRGIRRLPERPTVRSSRPVRIASLMHIWGGPRRGRSQRGSTASRRCPRQRRHPQHHRVHRDARTQPRLVPGRILHRLLFRCLRRVRAPRRESGRIGRRPDVQPRRGGLLREPDVGA
jgi:hypothetical protein